MALKRGYLIVAEGIDGAGKSTHCRLLGESLERKGYPVVSLREPTDGVWGRKIRKLLTAGRGGVSPDEELQYFLNDRKEDVEKNIQPALQDHKVVVLDRYFYSTAAYQGALGLDPETILRENETFAPRPDLVLLFCLAPAKGLQRIQHSRGAFSSFEKEAYLERVRAIFESFTGPHIRRIDADRDRDRVHAEVAAAVLSVLEDPGRSP